MHKAGLCTYFLPTRKIPIRPVIFGYWVTHSLPTEQIPVWVNTHTHLPISSQDRVCCGYFGNLRVCPVYKSDEQSERGRVLLSYKINVFTMFFLRECVCIIAAALAALPLSPPEILIHPQKNLLFKTIGLQPLIEWIVMPSTSAEDTFLEGIWSR